MPVTQSQIDALTRQIAYHLAKDYGLSERSFAIKFVATKRYEYKIASGGIIRVYWTHIPVPSFKVDYEIMMRRCLEQVAHMKKTRFTGIVVYGGSGHPKSIAANEHWERLPELLAFDKLSFRTLYKVEMKHDETGLVVIKEGLIGKRGVTVSRLMLDARAELSELVEALLKSQAEVVASVERKPATLGRVSGSRSEDSE